MTFVFALWAFVFGCVALDSRHRSLRGWKDIEPWAWCGCGLACALAAGVV